MKVGPVLVENTAKNAKEPSSPRDKFFMERQVKVEGPWRPMINYLLAGLASWRAWRSANTRSEKLQITFSWNTNQIPDVFQ
ncbi:hypothetical protein RCIA185 [Methanocella arvoryzae MRE50]|uniref:Uncharacterized protein n=1 Tax=Methanocella arvoryzae (strain DSM 22066 / NBRC 105507 / MRE50) TaxID=351160 RepID=Q0W211_METAR|nr:hypothetical protein RCIA185 [Methanocella arvoryzae MRE50]